MVKPIDEFAEISTVRKGTIGELAVIQDLLPFYNVYTPVCDDKETDLLVQTKSGYDRVNVKHISVLTSKTSIHLRGVKHAESKKIDVIAVYYKPVGIAYIPFKSMGYPKNINLAIHTAHNNQQKDRTFFYQFMRYPEFE